MQSIMQTLGNMVMTKLQPCYRGVYKIIGAIVNRQLTEILHGTK